MAVSPAAVYAQSVIVGVLLALGTSVCWALGNVFIQRAGQRLGGVRAMVWSLTVGAVVASAAALLLDERHQPVTAAVLGWGLVSGVAGLAAYAGLFYAFTHGQLSVTVPFTSSWSLVAGLFGLVVFGERPGGPQLLGAGVVFLGVLLVSIGAGHPGAAGPSRPEPPPRARRATLAALLAGLGFGVMMPALNRVSPALGVFGGTALAYMLCLAFGVPLARLLRLELRVPDVGSWRLVNAAGVFETAGFVLLTLAGRAAPLAVVAPVASLGAALTLVYAFLALRERPGALALAGALLASVGVVVLALK